MAGGRGGVQAVRSDGGHAVHLRGHDAVGQGGVRRRHEPHGLRRLQAGCRHPRPRSHRRHRQPVGSDRSAVLLLCPPPRFM
jgi:hypothetical protein